jgi:hypothetical protein
MKTTANMKIQFSANDRVADVSDSNGAFDGTVVGYEVTPWVGCEALVIVEWDVPGDKFIDRSLAHPRDLKWIGRK